MAERPLTAVELATRIGTVGPPDVWRGIAAMICRWVISCGVALLLAACGPDTPTPVLLTETAPTAAATMTEAAPPVVATASIAQPLVPAFTTSTVAFSGAGPLAASLPFLLPGGTYHVTWDTHPIGPAGSLTPWKLVGTIHAATAGSNNYPLLNVSVSASGPQHGELVQENIPAGTYVLEVAAEAMCSWTISIHP